MAIEIKYNNAVIASLMSGQMATIECANKVMVDNIEIVARGMEAKIKYKHSVIASLVSGQKATIECVGKVMRSNIVVADGAFDVYLTLVDENGNILVDENENTLILE